MSSNNYILIKKDNSVWHLDAETNEGEMIGQGKTLKQAAEIAGKFTKEMEKEGIDIEYGVRFEFANETNKTYI